MSLAVSPSLTPMGRSDTGTDPAARALQALVQMAANAEAPLEALVKAVAANNLTTLVVSGETLQVRLSVALPVGTALTIAPAPSNPAAVSVQVKPQATIAQMAPEAPAQAASAAIVSAMTAAPVPAAPARMTRTSSQLVAGPPTAPPDDATAIPSAPLATGVARNASPGVDVRPPAAPSAGAAPADAPELPSMPAARGGAAPTAQPPEPGPKSAAMPAPATGSVPASGAVATPAVAVPAPKALAPGLAMPSQSPVPTIATGSTAALPTPISAANAMPTANPAAPANLGTPAAAPMAQVAPRAPSALTSPLPPVATPAPVQIAAQAVQASPAQPVPPPTQTIATAVVPTAPATGEAEPSEAPLPEPSRKAPIPYATAPRPSAAPQALAPTPDLARAIATQQPLAPMLADAARVAADPAMPQPLRAAAQQMVAQAIDPTKAPLDAAILKQGVETAGVLRPLSPLANPDLANRLAALRDVLANLLGDDAVAQRNERRRPSSPPLRGDAPHAERSEMLPLADEPPRSLAHRLLAETDGALSRLKLLQAASQPADGRAPDPARPAEYRVEVPMLLGREATTIQFVFDREAQPQEPKKPRGWRMRFALNVAALGEVGADISILGAATQVTVWASETETAALIEQMLPDLAPALAARGLEPGAIRMRHGRPGSVATGRVLDSAT